MKRAPSGVASTRDLDVTAGGRELDGVADEVAEHLAEAGRVVRLDDGLGRQRQPERDALALGHRLGVVDGVLGDRAQVLVAQLQGDEAGIELGELEQVGGQPVEALDLLAAAAQELVARRRDPRPRLRGAAR